MHETECDDEGMQEEEDEEENAPSTLVDHPQSPSLAPGVGPVRRDLVGHGGIRPLQTLQPPALSLVALQVTSVGREGNVAHIRVLLQRRHLAIGEVEA